MRRIHSCHCMRNVHVPVNIIFNIFLTHHRQAVERERLAGKELLLSHRSMHIILYYII